MKAKYDFSFEQLEMETLDLEENKDKIVKRKQVELKPMDEDEAILQMELLGHDFYVFKEAKTNEIYILYRRKDGDYGIIETKA